MAQANETSDGASARQVINNLISSTGAFTALASTFEAGLLEAVGESRSLAGLSQQSGIPTPLVEGLLDVLVAVGLLQREGDVYSSAPDLLLLLQPPFRDPLLAAANYVRTQVLPPMPGATPRLIVGQRPES